MICILTWNGWMNVLYLVIVASAEDFFASRTKNKCVFTLTRAVVWK